MEREGTQRDGERMGGRGWEGQGEMGGEGTGRV